MEKSHTMATRERTVRGRRFSDRVIAGVLRIFSRVHITLYRWTGGIIGERIGYLHRAVWIPHSRGVCALSGSRNSAAGNLCVGREAAL